MNLDINYGLTEKENPEKRTNAEITHDWVSYAVSRKHLDGLKGQMIRMWGRIQRKIDAANEAHKTTIDLDENEKEFVKKVVLDENIGWPPGAAKVVMILQDEVEKL